jgi:hypothetical protein
MSILLEDVSALPVGHAPQPVPTPHFPSALYAVIWRNWDVIEVNFLAEVLRATPEQIEALAATMGLPEQRAIAPDELRRNYMTVLRRNWHLLPYEQLCQILKWTAAEMQFFLNEDDFLYIKLGRYKPDCAPVYYEEPDEATRAHIAEIARIVREDMAGVIDAPAEPLFTFIQRFENATPPTTSLSDVGEDGFQFCIVYPYFLRYGEPLLGDAVADVPDGYFAALAASGVSGIWIQAVLNNLAPWELAPELSQGWEERIDNLNLLIERAGKYGVKVYLYFNEPRALPNSFFEMYPELRGMSEVLGMSAMCTSTQPVQDFIVNSVKHIFEKAPGLGGSFAITYSENLTNCFSRDIDEAFIEEYKQHIAETGNRLDSNGVQPACLRCAERGPEVVNAEVCTLIERGMRLAGSDGRFLLYFWSTPGKWFPGMTALLPESTHVICISEWGKTFTRGDYTGQVNEYSMSVIGPSEQSLRQWDIAKQRGLKIAAKMQAANTYEFSSIPYIPALYNVAQHLANVSETGVSGVLLGWTTGGAPSPNLELVAEFARNPRPTVDEAVLNVATRRFGAEAAPGVVEAWRIMSEAYREFPFDISVCYCGPQSLGPANLLFAEPSGYSATMSTYPFDDLKAWAGPYSPETLQSQFEKVAEMTQAGVDILAAMRTTHPSPEIEDEWRIAEASRIHYRSTANQIHQVRIRETDPAAVVPILEDEIDLSLRLIELVAQDSRIGFEASNQYGYLRFDLAEKILNCRQLLGQMA